MGSGFSAADRRPGHTGAANRTRNGAHQRWRDARAYRFLEPLWRPAYRRWGSPHHPRRRRRWLRARVDLQWQARGHHPGRGAASQRSRRHACRRAGKAGGQCVPAAGNAVEDLPLGRAADRPYCRRQCHGSENPEGCASDAWPRAAQRHPGRSARRQRRFGRAGGLHHRWQRLDTGSRPALAGLSGYPFKRGRRRRGQCRHLRRALAG